MIYKGRSPSFRDEEKFKQHQRRTGKPVLDKTILKRFVAFLDKKAKKKWAELPEEYWAQSEKPEYIAMTFSSDYKMEENQSGTILAGPPIYEPLNASILPHSVSLIKIVVPKDLKKAPRVYWGFMVNDILVYKTIPFSDVADVENVSGVTISPVTYNAFKAVKEGTIKIWKEWKEEEGIF